MGKYPRIFIRIIRPHQWVKNLLIIAPPFFGGTLFSSEKVMIEMILAFIAFSLASSAGYIINDIADINTDRLHPRKKLRPLASGEIGIAQALVMIAITAAVSMALSLKIAPSFAFVVALYLALDILYSFYIKHIAILGSFSIALGFVLRITAGGAASGVEISSWLFLATFLLSLLLAFGKRRQELLSIKGPQEFRKELSNYTTVFLDTAIAIFSTTAIVTYSLYAVDRGPRIFIATVPFVCYGVLRYLYLVQNRGEGDPTEALLSDKALFACVFLWIVVTALIINFNYLLGLFP